MKNYDYKSRNPQGKSVTGVIEAETESEAIQELRRRGLTVTSIQGNKSFKKKGKLSFSLPNFSTSVNSLSKRIPRKEIVPVARQLATMFESGIPLVESLEVIEEQCDNENIKSVLGDIASEVRQGKDFSHALARHPKVFDNIFINMIKAGEASGQLNDVLDRLATHMEESEELKGEIKSAMTYPVVSLVMICCISLGLLVFVLPQFRDIFNNLKQEMPTLTEAVMNLSDLAQSNFGLILFSVLGSIIGTRILIKTHRGRRVWDALILRIPIFGPLIQKTIVSRFSGTFATLIRSGVPILGALEIVSKTTGNVHYSEAIEKSAEAVRQGESLGNPLTRTKRFPPMVCRMIAIGERSGSLEQLLEKVSQFYDSEVRTTVKQLTSLIEPFLILFMGGIVGTMVLAMFLPLLKMIGNM
ncbi:MAG: type II secretion system F family protein [Planctomycetia bacterium]|jgi:type IV pilus assembly protein PilC|nr:type II secretion system F family protein [Planctomycetia bacterium]